MKVHTPGHAYWLEDYEHPEYGQELRFIHKQPSPDRPGDLELVHDGTTNEELLAMLIDRMQYLQEKFPCRENATVITKLEESLMWLEKRTRDRQNRGVEGKHQP